MNVIPRHLAAPVERALASSRIVNIVGPRQAGKTTLVRDLIASARYVTLDDDAIRSALSSDPYGQLSLFAEVAKEAARPVVLDEVQRVPAITAALKRIVDADRRPGQFILTGSSDIFTSGAAYDSLAGRVATLTLRPLSAAEIFGASPCRLLDLSTGAPDDILAALPRPRPFGRASAVDLILRGGYPEIRGLDGPDRARRYESYLDSIIERDVAPIASVRKPDVLRRLIDQLAGRTAEELNIAGLCNALGVRKETAETYLDVLTRLGIVHRLGAWTSSSARREIRAPKLHFLDTGCAAALRGEDTACFGAGGDLEALGHLLETFVFDEVEKSLPHLATRWRLFHWRTQSHEVDILAVAPGRRIAIVEVKAAASIDRRDFRHIEWFVTQGPGRGHRCMGFVVYLGKELLSFGPGRIALPLSMLWSFD